MTKAKVFQSDAPLDERRVIIRRHDGDVEMVSYPGDCVRSMVARVRCMWCAQKEGCFRPIAAWCRHPSFAIAVGGKNFSFLLANGDWFYFAGIWRQASNGWPGAYAILTIEANADIAPYHERQMAVLTRHQRMDWLDGIMPEEEILRPLPARTFRVSPLSNASFQPPLAV